jgi:tetratricopeptide (TPR) repeat protein
MSEKSALQRGREAYATCAWSTAFELLADADRQQPLAAPDLERLARAAYMLGRDDEYVASLERAQQQYGDCGDVPRAVRCGFWIGHSFLFRGESARATGWFARAARLLETIGDECVERGYLLIPIWLDQMSRGNFADGYATAVEAAAVGERFHDPDLVWLARDEQARALMRLGRVKEGLRLVDEALAVAAAGELSPVVTGIVYCNTIAFCRGIYDVRHVREWTRALTDWCERQPEMIAHNGLCLVHRAEIKLLAGDWDGAREEARRSAERFSRGVLNRLAAGSARYCVGEVHRLRGEFEAAEEAYREASLQGCEPQPGLAKMRLTQGNIESAAAMIRRTRGDRRGIRQRAVVGPGRAGAWLAASGRRTACRRVD